MMSRMPTRNGFSLGPTNTRQAHSSPRAMSTAPVTSGQVAEAGAAAAAEPAAGMAGGSLGGRVGGWVMAVSVSPVSPTGQRCDRAQPQSNP